MKGSSSAVGKMLRGERVGPAPLSSSKTSACLSEIIGFPDFLGCCYNNDNFQVGHDGRDQYAIICIATSPKGPWFEFRDYRQKVVEKFTQKRLHPLGLRHIQCQIGKHCLIRIVREDTYRGPIVYAKIVGIRKDSHKNNRTRFRITDVCRQIANITFGP